MTALQDWQIPKFMPPADLESRIDAATDWKTLRAIDAELDKLRERIDRRFCQLNAEAMKDQRPRWLNGGV